MSERSSQTTAPVTTRNTRNAVKPLNRLRHMRIASMRGSGVVDWADTIRPPKAATGLTFCR
jgi:hypothetical protein